jgi:hypothetical protein
LVDSKKCICHALLGANIEESAASNLRKFFHRTLVLLSVNTCQIDTHDVNGTLIMLRDLFCLFQIDMATVIFSICEQNNDATRCLGIFDLR